MKVIIDIDAFFDEYMAYYNMFNAHPSKSVRDAYIHNHTDDAMTHGKWLTVIGYGITEETYMCSECRGLVHQKTKYCPHCSALMRQKKNQAKTVVGKWRHIQGYDCVEGRMIRHDEYECSECNHMMYYQYGICPNCGIKMECCADNEKQRR